MDVLSDVARSIRTHPARFIRSRRGPGWGSRFGPYRGAGFHLVLAGSCWLIRDGHDPLRLQVGDVLLLPHGSEHGLADQPEAELRMLPADPGPQGDQHDLPEGSADVRVDLLCGAYEIDPTLVHPLLRSLPDVIFVPRRAGGSGLGATVEMLTEELGSDRPGGAGIRAALLDLALVQLLRTWLAAQAETNPRTGWPAVLVDPALADTLARIHDDPAHPWTVPELAAAVGMSKTAFARRFVRTIGLPPMAYLTWWRLSSAARALAETDAPISRIAREVGYGSQFAFSNAFRRATGSAPGQFRRDRATRTGHDGRVGDVVATHS